MSLIVRVVRAAWWPALALAAVAVAAACADSTLSVSDSARLVPTSGATYSLVTVNGQPVPVEIRKDTSETVTLAGGDLQLSTSSFSQRLVLVSTPPVGQASSRDSYAQGTVTVNGTHVHFRASDGAEWDGIASPGWITYTVPGNSGPVTFAFRQE
ncbi:MAG: hypothetical protein ACJ8GN_15910 [Longimicrobiaceae bacterium]